jgi:hypothetical protein
VVWEALVAETEEEVVVAAKAPPKPKEKAIPRGKVQLKAAGKAMAG